MRFWPELALSAPAPHAWWWSPPIRVESARCDKFDTDAQDKARAAKCRLDRAAHASSRRSGL
jgi:hypothetical protein